MQLQRSHTHSNTPSSNIRTTSWLMTTQPVSTPEHAPRSHVPHSMRNLFITQRTPRPYAGQIVTTPISPSNHTHLQPHTYNLVLCDPTSVDPLTYLPPPVLPPGIPSNVFTCSTNRNHGAGTHHESSLYPPLTIHTASFSYPKRVDLPTYTPSPLTIHTPSFS